MWEWQVFFQGSFRFRKFNNVIKSIFNQTPLETRKDNYVDLNTPLYGLKERGTMEAGIYSPYLELKVLLDKTLWNAELWSKDVKIKIDSFIIPKSGLDKDSLLNYIKEDQKKKNSIHKEQFEHFLSMLEREPFNRVVVDKKRKNVGVKYNFQKNTWQFSQRAEIEDENSPEVLIIEEGEIEFLDQFWQTFQVEGNNTEVLKKFTDFFVMPKNGHVMGYPQFLDTNKETPI